MEYLKYREAEFDVIRTMSCERTRIRDEANNYLYHHWDFTVEVHWQPAMTAYTMGNNGVTPKYTPGTLPGETDLALLSHMLQPRGLLQVTAGNSIVLETPSMSGHGRLPCDVKGGPSCEMIGVPVMIGFRHWVVTLHFIADVRNPDPLGSDPRNAILSNLWVSTEDIDFQRRSTRHFAGRAILRADVMRQAGVNSNSFRDLYLFKCPDHYQRMNVSVQISQDGTVCDWSFQDVMRGYDLGVGSPIVSIECFRTGYITKGTVTKGIIDAARSSLRTAASGHPLDALTGLTFGLFGAQMDNLPKYYIQCRCDLVGDRNANLGQLTRIALGVCINQVGIAGINDALTGSTEFIFRQDLADQVYTSVEITKRLSDDALVIAGLAVGLITDPVALLRGVTDANDLSVTAIAPGSAAMMQQLQQDSIQVISGVAPNLVPIVPPPPGANQDQIKRSSVGIVADRKGDPVFKQNPPLRQGAFGAIPASVAPAIASLGTVPGLAGSVATGAIPDGIEKLIVQALIGENLSPPLPTTLVRES